MRASRALAGSGWGMKRHSGAGRTPRVAWLGAAVAALLLANGPCPACSAETDGQLWATGRINHPIGERFALSLLAQGRFDDEISESDLWLIRPAVAYRLWEAVWVSVGYDYVRFVDRFDENRFWQEVALPLRFGPFVLGNRLRIEQRWIEGVGGLVARTRYRVRGAHPISSTRAYLVASNEVFLNLNDQGTGPRSGFEQNWLFGGLGLLLGSHARAEVGYLWRYFDGRRRNRNDHVLGINLFLDTRGRKKPVPVREEGHQ